VVAGKVGTTAGAGGLRREQPPATNTIAAHHTTATDRMPPRVCALFRRHLVVTAGGQDNV